MFSMHRLGENPTTREAMPRMDPPNLACLGPRIHLILQRSTFYQPPKLLPNTVNYIPRPHRPLVLYSDITSPRRTARRFANYISWPCLLRHTFYHPPPLPNLRQSTLPRALRTSHPAWPRPQAPA